MIDDVGDLAVGLEQPLAEAEQRLLVGQVEREVVELARDRVGDPGRLLEVRGVGPFEERERVPGADLEEVVAQRARHRRRHEPHAEHALVEPDGGVHVGGDERQVVDAAPARDLGHHDLLSVRDRSLRRRPGPFFLRRDR